jgi:hypothetical protein
LSNFEKLNLQQKCPKCAIFFPFSSLFFFQISFLPENLNWPFSPAVDVIPMILWLVGDGKDQKIFEHFQTKMLEIGQTFESILRANESNESPQIHWVQIFAYDFGFGGQLPRPKHWKSVVVDLTESNREGNEDEEGHFYFIIKLYLRIVSLF